MYSIVTSTVNIVNCRCYQILHIVEHTTEIKYEGIEPSSTRHVLDARFSQASVLNNVKTL
jgi:hypothetical protein